MRTTAIFRDPLFLAHLQGPHHPESPERLAVIYEALDNPARTKMFLFPAFAPADQQILRLNHAADYVKRVAATAGQPRVSLDPDTQTSPLSYQAACLAAGAAVKGVEMLMVGEATNAFCLVRPPGHHAEHHRAMGFCLFNNVAIAAHYAIQKFGLQRILIVDWDLHHGNGTQNSFYETDQVLYFSTHQYPYYPGTGAAYEVGTGKGEGYTINVPLTAGLDDRAYATIFNELLAPIAREYQPQLILLSAGYDIHCHDPLGGMGVTEAGFAYLSKVVLDLATELGHNRVLACLEGGYDLKGLQHGILATLDEMRGVSTLDDKTVMNLTTTAVPVPGLAETRNIAKRYWNL